MKHLKLFESFRGDIHNICRKYGIKNYSINEDGSIDVDGSVDLSSRKLNRLPLKFRKVTIYFDCGYNQLTSLEGCPGSVGGYFRCDYNQLKSLEGCPKSVGGGFMCESNQLTSLEGCPEKVGGDFHCYGSKITTFEHLPLSIGGDFFCAFNPIFEIWKLFKDYDKIEFLNDCDAVRESDDDSEEPIIILDRLNFFLEEIGEKPVEKVFGYKCI